MDNQDEAFDGEEFCGQFSPEDIRMHAVLKDHSVVDDLPFPELEEQSKSGDFGFNAYLLLEGEEYDELLRKLHERVRNPAILFGFWSKRDDPVFGEWIPTFCKQLLQSEVPERIEDFKVEFRYEWYRFTAQVIEAENAHRSRSILETFDEE